MRRNITRVFQLSHLLPLAGLITLELVSLPKAQAQIFLSPNQQYPQRPRGTLDLGGGVRCSFEGGSSPSLSMSVGAYPDLLLNNVVVTPSTSGNVGSQSELFGVITLNIPLGQKNSAFSCMELLRDVQMRARLQSLRDLADENIISEAQYRKLAIDIFKKQFGSDVDASLAPPTPGNAVTLPAPESK